MTRAVRRAVAYGVPCLAATVTFSFAVLDNRGVISFNPWLGHIPGVGSIFLSHALGWGNAALAACGPTAAVLYSPAVTQRRLPKALAAGAAGVAAYFLLEITLLAIIGRR